MRTLVAALLASASALGCRSDPEVRTQWLVSVRTDAPVPQLGDRLLVELLDDSGSVACSACRRVFGAPSDAWPVSFGVLRGAGVERIRARLYRGSLKPDLEGVPSSSALIDFVGRMPEAHEKTSVGVVLRTECFSQPSDIAARTTCVPENGGIGGEPVLSNDDGEPAVGSSPLAERGACPNALEAGMTCVPGGLFLLGSPEVRVVSTGSLSGPEHLVRLGSFALDTDEMTVGSVRALIESGRLSGQPDVQGTSGTAKAACTYLGPNDPSHDNWPINCVSRALASEVCAALGKRLPTEAEWEWAAGNLEQETRYPWSSADAEPCSTAVIARGRDILELTDFAQHPEEASVCRTAADTGILAWGPVPGGSPSDVSELGLENLAGNLSEFVLDDFAEYEAPCWSGDRVLFDPSCNLLSRTANASIRGGSWGSATDRADATVRSPASPAGDWLTGFRCASPLE